MKEFVEKLIEKIKVTSLEIIVTGTKDKPYFEIKYKVVGKEDYNIGYSSYDLNNVLNWKEECFEIVNQLAEEYKGKLVSADEVGYMLDCIEMRGDETWMDYYHKALEGLCELRGKDTNVTTNADRIRNMSDEELEKFIEKVSGTCIVDALGGKSDCNAECRVCKINFGSILGWLKSEVKGSDV